MTFEIVEASVQDGAPVELYTFTVYGVNYRYTSAAADLVFASQTYVAYAINRPEIESTDELPRNDLDLDVPLDFPVLDFYDSAPPSDVIRLQIQRFHRGDNQAAVWWRGRVLNGERVGGKGVLHCENKFTSLKQTGLRRLYGAMCPHVLYGAACRKVEADVQISLQLDGVAGVQLSAAIFDTYDDGRFAGGIIYYEPSPGRIEKRGIKSHVGNTIEITHPIPGLLALTTILASPGCKHVREDCDGFHHNIENFGGFPFVPKQNPMGSTSVFS